jgi:HTH-type transcriptional regulator / antitoxin HipB
MSITNARQYRITKAQLQRFEQAMAAPKQDHGEPRTGTEWIVEPALLEQARNQADELRTQLEEYERLSGSKIMTLEVHSLADLPSALVHARLASGLTQKALAEQLGVTPQQVPVSIDWNGCGTCWGHGSTARSPSRRNSIWLTIHRASRASRIRARWRSKTCRAISTWPKGRPSGTETHPRVAGASRIRAD